ncbi:transmembrane protein 132C-like protein, partial [Lates japonicus]
MTVCSLPLLLLERAVDFLKAMRDQALLFHAVYHLAAVRGAQLSSSATDQHSPVYVCISLHCTDYTPKKAILTGELVIALPPRIVTNHCHATTLTARRVRDRKSMGYHGLLHQSKYLEFDGKEKESLERILVDSKVILEGLQRYGPTPIYLPVSYRILNAESAFFLQEANQDLMRNSSLQARTESFFVHQARQMPFVNASYGPLSVQQPVPLELLQTLPGSFNMPSFTSSSVPTSTSSPPLFTFNWKVHTYIISERIHPSWPKVQVLFYIAGRDWDDYSAIHKLPCVRMFAFHETQEVRGTCRLKGELGICVAELEPLASWFSPPTVRPGRQRVSEQAQGTPVELYYMVQNTDNGDCNSEDSRKGSSLHTDQPRPMGYFAGHTPMQRIGSVRLFQPLSELKLDNNFVVMAPSKPIRQRETVSTFLALSTLSSVQIFTLRVKLKDGVAFLGARASNPVAWTVSQDVRSEGHRVVTLHCRRKENSFSQ